MRKGFIYPTFDFSQKHYIFYNSDKFENTYYLKFISGKHYFADINEIKHEYKKR